MTNQDPAPATPDAPCISRERREAFIHALSAYVASGGGEAQLLIYTRAALQIVPDLLNEVQRLESLVARHAAAVEAMETCELCCGQCHSSGHLSFGAPDDLYCNACRRAVPIKEAIAAGVRAALGGGETS